MLQKIFSKKNWPGIGLVVVPVVISVTALLGVLANPDLTQQARDAALSRGLSTLTCWAPDGTVVLHEKGLLRTDIQIMSHNIRVFRGGELLGYVFNGTPCVMLPDAAPASRG